MSVIELRQYTLKPGRRDDLITLFEREFVESQEAEGIDLIGTFRDANDPDRLVWLRRFPDMEARAKSLAAFYGGPVWKANRNQANDTMIDSDNVLLLKPAWDGADFPGHDASPRRRSELSEKGSVIASIHYFADAVSDDFVTGFKALKKTACVAALVTEPAANSFPALPVREGEHVFVALYLFASEAAPVPALPPDLAQCTEAREILHLLPTARCRLAIPVKS